jgi:hypothetical protein
MSCCTYVHDTLRWYRVCLAPSHVRISTNVIFRQQAQSENKIKIKALLQTLEVDSKYRSKRKARLVIPKIIPAFYVMKLATDLV